jgi:hypothetical protein
MSVRGAIFLGVGSMVGAGIFALLGEAGGSKASETDTSSGSRPGSGTSPQS